MPCWDLNRLFLKVYGMIGAGERRADLKWFWRLGAGGAIWRREPSPPRWRPHTLQERPCWLPPVMIHTDNSIKSWKKSCYSKWSVFFHCWLSSQSRSCFHASTDNQHDDNYCPISIFPRTLAHTTQTRLNSKDREAAGCFVWTILQGVVHIWARVDSSNQKIVWPTTASHFVDHNSIKFGIHHHRRLLVYLLNNNTPRHVQLSGVFGLVKWFEVITKN